jgi:hypothetical protein
MPLNATLGWLCALPGLRRAQLETGGPWSLEGVDQDSPCLRTDSRHCQSGDLFVALRGNSADGHDHVPNLLEKGVVCVVESAWHLAQPEALRGLSGQLVVEDTRDWLPRAAARPTGRPAPPGCCNSCWRRWIPRQVWWAPSAVASVRARPHPRLSPRRTLPGWPLSPPGF